jgi:hypothetical protein
MLGVLLLVSQPPRKTPSSHQQLSRRGTIMMRLLARKGLVRNLLQQSFAHAHTGNCKRTQIQVPA